MLEHYLIFHCSPTLAGLKTANLFSLSSCPGCALEPLLNEWENRLSSKGVALCPLRRNDHASPLVYVYRPSKLARDLKRPGVSEFLLSLGYPSTHPEQALKHLASRIEAIQSFPHEIGLFLGYPLADVVGCIENSGKN